MAARNNASQITVTLYSSKKKDKALSDFGTHIQENQKTFLTSNKVKLDLEEYMCVNEAKHATSRENSNVITS